MNHKLRVAVVGVGYLGRFHALIYSRMPNVELVGILDSNRETADRVAAEAGCTAFYDHLELRDKIDAVSVVVPTSLHLEVARPFLEKGIHTLLEKPIATAVAEGAEIVEMAARSGALLQIGHLERYNAGVMELATRISNPHFIEAQRMSSFVARATDVDVISDLMIHDIDIILSLIDSDIVTVSAVGTPVLTNHIDIANARLEFANGCVANIIASRVSEKKSRRIRAFGPKHYLSLDFIEQRLNIAYPKPRPDEEWPEIVVETLDIAPVKPLDAELEDFVRCVVSRQKPLVDGHVGLEALDVAMRVKETILGKF
ncbi:MAG: Gfo/Idh/MocA family oxidoreductase [Gammaproteobacteria bacterium]|nr:Gfo/Idh/MocA family oxidoreductase [Gammaproteobacteria bacterium]MBU1654735.1 Gfo/Idh/MocA family oxidoreductase [Gammaproteobacteria bacterium]MBU1959656.1 Gfo/Idh/MocA family oxidoreductase [Gammaproteobacteria bacterium]